MRGRLVIGTRGSPLAMRQTQLVRTKLAERFPACAIELSPINAQADLTPQRPLAALAGEGVFVKELGTALLDGRIDCAVHSLKDLPLAQPPSLRVAAVLERGDARDCLMSRSGAPLDRLPQGARVGTSSVRRSSQLLRLRSDLAIAEIRGNIDTRLRKLDQGEHDAIVLAACGVIRLGLGRRITEYLDIQRMIPEPGQGALAVEVRADDGDLLTMVGALDDPVTRSCVSAERAFLRALGGGCRVPIAAYATLSGGLLELEGAVIAPDGRRHIRGVERGSMAEPVALGERLAERLSRQGAQDILSS